MANDETKAAGKSLARDLVLRNSFGSKVEMFSDEVKGQLALLDDDEIKVLVAIKEKLNSNLNQRLKEAVETVGAIIW